MSINTGSIIQIIPSADSEELHVVSFHLAEGMNGYTNVWRFENAEEMLKHLKDWYS